LLTSDARKATLYESPKFVVKVSRRHRVTLRDKRWEFVLTLGEPNYEEREFIKKCRKVGEPFPVKKIQLKFYPTKKKGKK